MMKTIDVQQAIDLINNNESLDGLAIIDLDKTQIKAVDAIKLADNGILIPEQNIIYRDEDVQYDSDFDDYKWTQLPKGTALSDLKNLVVQDPISRKESVLKIELEVEDAQTLKWANENYTSIKNIMNTLINELYSSRSIIESK